MDEKRLLLDEYLRADDPKADDARGDDTHEVAPDVAYQRIVFVNVIYLGPRDAGDRSWILVDSGVGSASQGPIRKAAEKRFGKGNRPSAIVLTHGHFDHIGAVQELADEWECPVYAHPLEFPYLNGGSKYPAPDPSVGGGMVALSSPTFPRGPIDLGNRLKALSGDGTIPGQPAWRWLAAPGHSVGQVALWRESDRLLIAADAFVTTDQESLYAALTQKPELQGPPAYFTIDWPTAKATVQKLSMLEPKTVITGHGRAYGGSEFRSRLYELAEQFDRIAIPKDGKYVLNPARAEDGSAYTS